MGAWGYEPMDDDLALDWLASEVEAPLLDAIERTLQGYLDELTEKDDKIIEAIAAAALLGDLTGDHTKMKYLHFNSGYLGYEANEADLWSLAGKVIEKIMEEEKDWLSGWNDPQQKVQVLKRLVSDLRQIKSVYVSRET
jgi:sulfur relay (sulfurtransferase) DsrC/TusE family protein